MSRDAVAARWAPEPMTFEKECRERETPETNKVPTQKEIDVAKSEFRKHARKMLVSKPFKLSSAWMENIESRVGRVMKFKSSQDFDEDSAPVTTNLLELNEEIQDGFRFAQRCASLMYDLRDPIERDELSIDYDAIVYSENWLRQCENPHSTFDWKVLRICPSISHESLLSLRDRMDVVHKTLGTTNLDLNMIWTESFSKEAFARPESNEMRKMIPVEISDFTSWVEEQITNHRKRLKQDWMSSKVVPTLKKGASGLTSRKKERFVKMTSSLLSRQLRDCVNISMNEMLSFFRWASSLERFCLI